MRRWKPWRPVGIRVTRTKTTCGAVRPRFSSQSAASRRPLAAYSAHASPLRCLLFPHVAFAVQAYHRCGARPYRCRQSSVHHSTNSSLGLLGCDGSSCCTGAGSLKSAFNSALHSAISIRRRITELISGSMSMSVASKPCAPRQLLLDPPCARIENVAAGRRQQHHQIAHQIDLLGVGCR